MTIVRACGWILFCCTAAPRAQEVVLDGGEVLAGTVERVHDNRVYIHGADGAVRMLPVRGVVGERSADGTLRRFHAGLRDAALDPVENGMLAQVQAGKEVALPELLLATERCSRAFADALQAQLTEGKPAARLQAARLLAATLVPEAVKAALAAAVADTSGRMLAAVAELWGSPSLGALEAASALPLLDQGLSTTNARARFAMAWLGAQLGSDAALPVLVRCLGDRDHHVRESAACVLAERGDASGATIVLQIAKRDRAPVQTANRGGDAETRALVDRIALRERRHACELLGKLRHEPALAVLRKLAASKEPTLAASARDAVAAITAGH